MWNEPYLETCCRSALHRLVLAGKNGRPDDREADLKDARCLERLAGLGFALHADGSYRITPEGAERHRTEIGGEAGTSGRRAA